MRAGTQTLIQALQALPLLDEQENDDEFMSPGMSPPESDSDDEGKHGGSLLPCDLSRAMTPLSNDSGILYSHDLSSCGPFSSRAIIIQLIFS